MNLCTIYLLCQALYGRKYLYNADLLLLSEEARGKSSTSEEYLWENYHKDVCIIKLVLLTGLGICWLLSSQPLSLVNAYVSDCECNAVSIEIARKCLVPHIPDSQKNGPEDIVYRPARSLFELTEDQDRVGCTAVSV